MTKPNRGAPGWVCPAGRTWQDLLIGGFHFYHDQDTKKFLPYPLL